MFHVSKGSGKLRLLMSWDFKSLLNCFMDHSEKFEVNKKTWNQKTSVHFESEFYDKHAFAKAKNTLNHYELHALGDVSGKSLLHLQCHFGQDSLSWAHRGAQVTAIDLSEVAIDKARALSDQLNIPATFKCCNVYDTATYVKERFNKELR
jgi:2-polyprenyl-3-methyl-5-hydroxy-6-metoxy-1,4-benzoquinol methylase